MPVVFRIPFVCSQCSKELEFVCEGAIVEQQCSCECGQDFRLIVTASGCAGVEAVEDDRPAFEKKIVKKRTRKTEPKRGSHES